MSVYVVCYDISDDDLRDEVSTLLAEYGERVQHSVFEVKLRSEAEFVELRGKLQKILGDTPELRFYRLCKSCQSESSTLVGESVAVFPSTIIV